jgi:hypothetical protein
MLLAATGAARFNAKGTIDDPATVPKPTVVRVLLPRKFVSGTNFGLD